MKKIYGILILFTQIDAVVFNIVNQTDQVMRITWKSNGLGSESKSGAFDLPPGATCDSCLQTYNGNCLHYLFAQTLDKSYKAQSKNFCKNSKIIISWENTKSWFTKKDIKKLKITLEKLLSGESI